MKKLVALICIAVMLCGSGVVFADQTGKTAWHRHSYTDTDTQNIYINKLDSFEAGLGLDAILYEFDGEFKGWGLDAVEAQGKYDFNNDGWETYIVMKVNLFRVVKKAFGK